MSFIFGGGTGETAESIARKRAVAQAMMQQGRGAPRNVGEGISSAVNSITGALLEKRGRRQADEGNAAAWAPVVAALAGQEPQAPAAEGFNLDAVGESLGVPSRTGGSRSWRNNNPGNIEFGDFAQRHGATGSDGRFAIFPDENAGRGAMESLLFGPSYVNLSVADAIGRYAPSSENDVGAYVGAVTGVEGITPDMLLSSMGPEQRAAFVDAMIRHEGWKPSDTGGPAMTASAVTDPVTPTAQAVSPDMLPALMQAAASGHLNQGQMAVVQALMQRDMAQPETMSPYQQASLGLRQRELEARLGGQINDAPVVNVEAAQPVSPYDEAQAAGLERGVRAISESAAATFERGREAAASLGTIEQLEGALSNIETGTLANWASIAQNTFGIQAQGSSAQLAGAIIERLVPQQRPPGSGVMSDADIRMFRASLPSLVGTAEGNAEIIFGMRALAEYQAQAAQISGNYLANRMTMPEYLDALTQLDGQLSEKFRTRRESKPDLYAVESPDEARRRLRELGVIQ